MRTARVDGTFDDWTRQARLALQRGVVPADLRWIDARDGQEDLFAAAVTEAETAPAAPGAAYRVPAQFLTLARDVSGHRAPRPWTLLYRVLWRLTHGEPALLQVAVDPDTRELERMAKDLRHEDHRMHAFVRFREQPVADGVWYVAWYEPRHDVVERNGSFFRDRFANQRWSILTPERCMHWDGTELWFTPGVDRAQAPAGDDVEALWRRYYRSTFNPARLKLDSLRGHLPQRYWQNLPETQDIPAMVAEAPERLTAMQTAAQAKAAVTAFVPYEVPAGHDLSGLARDVQQCRGCPLWKSATCAVFGEGPPRARVLVVGEQPGDQEDRAGRPFVGPAGQLLDRAFRAAGIDRSELYVTNAVKHFKWTPRGKRRLHQKPTAREIAACRPWLEAEIQRVQPELLVCLGATATWSVTATELRVTEARGGQVASIWGIPALITVHPSSLLRLPDGTDPAREFDRFVRDLASIRRLPPQH